jgi:putative transposase
MPPETAKPIARSPVLIDLALQGGGAHGAFTWGVLDRLLEEPWLEIDGISGTSASAMNAAVLVYGHQEGGAAGARRSRCSGVAYRRPPALVPLAHKRTIRSGRASDRELHKRRVANMRDYPQWRWYLDELFVELNGKLCYLWRAVDHKGEVLESIVTAKRDKPAALKLLKRIMKKYGSPRSVVTDGCGAYSAAMKEIGFADRHEVGRRLNNRAENSHQPFRRRERAMQRFRSLKTLQKFSSAHAQVHNQFSQERHLVTQQVYKRRRFIALGEWRALKA